MMKKTMTGHSNTTRERERREKKYAKELPAFLWLQAYDENK